MIPRRFVSRSFFALALRPARLPPGAKAPPGQRGWTKGPEHRAARGGRPGGGPGPPVTALIRYGRLAQGHGYPLRQGRHQAGPRHRRPSGDRDRVALSRRPRHRHRQPLPGREISRRRVWPPFLHGTAPGWSSLLSIRRPSLAAGRSVLRLCAADHQLPSLVEAIADWAHGRAPIGTDRWPAAPLRFPAGGGRPTTTLPKGRSS